MAESKTKKLNRFKNTREKIYIKIIQLCVKKSFIISLTIEQRVSITQQINRLSKKKEQYDRKIKELEVAIHEKR